MSTPRRAIRTWSFSSPPAQPSPATSPLVYEAFSLNDYDGHVDDLKDTSHERSGQQATTNDDDKASISGAGKIQEDNPDTPSASSLRDLNDKDAAKQAWDLIIAIVVGHSSIQQSFLVARRLLMTHSTFMAEKLSDPNSPESLAKTVYLSDMHPCIFRAFYRYIVSGICHVDQLRDSHVVGTQILVWVCGGKLGCKSLQDVVLRQLYAELEPAARSLRSNRTVLTIRPDDVQLVCTHTAPNSPLRRLLFDAIVSHYTSADLMNLGWSVPLNRTTWLDMYQKYSDFNAMIDLTVQYTAAQRFFAYESLGWYLQHVDESTPVNELYSLKQTSDLKWVSMKEAECQEMSRLREQAEQEEVQIRDGAVHLIENGLTTLEQGFGDDTGCRADTPMPNIDSDHSFTVEAPMPNKSLDSLYMGETDPIPFMSGDNLGHSGVAETDIPMEDKLDHSANSGVAEATNPPTENQDDFLA